MPTPKPDPEAARAAPKRPLRRRFPRGGPTKAELRKLREKLVRLGTEILRSSKTLADEALKSAGEATSLDSMADHGTDNFEQAFSLTLLEGEQELLRDIQAAIDKIDGRGELPYGLCENCADEAPTEGSDHRCGTCPWIAKGRLEAVPYARLCVNQQELEEREGA